MSHRGSILVVDDDFAFRDSMAEVLRLEGYDVVHAEDGPPALALLRDPARSIGLVLLDLFMPLMSGLDVLDQKASDPAINRIPVILMTAFTDVQLKLYGGVVAIVPKGSRTEGLLSMIRSVCSP